MREATMGSVPHSPPSGTDYGSMVWLCSARYRLGQGWRSQMRSLFEPRSIGGGRGQVIGCSPGCLLISLLASIVLTVVLNLLLNWF